ncbi:MAG: type II toxin-antitoxin system RelE/ParE family toxin [Actinobacteria bacterium]|nr:type II toxin-antitoxin system RelE/ParE family toxin [Actinomycetota bacterium]
MSWAIKQTRRFLRTYKRLHTNQLHEVNQAIEAVAANPLLGEPKKGDLKRLRVHKFKCLGQQLLLGYTRVYSVDTKNLDRNQFWRCAKS